MDLVVEDEYGLWEVLWRIETQDRAIAREQAIERIRHAILELAEADWIRIECRGRRSSRLIPPTELLEHLLIGDAWYPPESESEDSLMIVATPKGESAFFES